MKSLTCPLVLLLLTSIASAQEWKRHTIDDTSEGADSVRLADVNGDGRLDIVTAWEEGNVVRAYLHPGPEKAKEPWPAVTVGRVRSPEDAVFIDLDGDGAVDVVSSCEGRTRSVFVHWAPSDPDEYLNPVAWQTEAFPALEGQAQWMYALPLQIDGKNGVDLVLGAKEQGAPIGWLQSPENPRELAAWQWHPLSEAGWIMSLIGYDMNGNGQTDILASDRKGPDRGVFWLENPGPAPEQTRPWTRQAIGGENREVMFLNLAHLDGDGRPDVIAATRGDELLGFLRRSYEPGGWERFSIPLPESFGTGKGVAVGDVNLDGRNDVVVTAENARGKAGVIWLSRQGPLPEAQWIVHEVSGRNEGVKYDLVVLIDLDGDGDLDILTCEESDNLGVVWYENPALSSLP
ncbi:hypothetical protein BH23PLA1_BH23PLA1_12620 [soil metagenome]